MMSSTISITAKALLSILNGMIRSFHRPSLVEGVATENISARIVVDEPAPLSNRASIAILTIRCGHGIVTYDRSDTLRCMGWTALIVSQSLPIFSKNPPAIRSTTAKINLPARLCHIEDAAVGGVHPLVVAISVTDEVVSTKTPRMQESLRHPLVI
tara:strand:- start:22075 stop:22542 length:468 start_codon:yes stop_codon:yes gene_type:complete